MKILIIFIIRIAMIKYEVIEHLLFLWSFIVLFRILFYAFTITPVVDGSCNNFLEKESGVLDLLSEMVRDLSEISDYNKKLLFSLILYLLFFLNPL